MNYKIESIGAQFSDSAITGLEQRFDSLASEGYKFHSVFHVTQPGGCLGGQPTNTYLAIYVKEE